METGQDIEEIIAEIRALRDEVAFLRDTAEAAATEPPAAPHVVEHVDSWRPPVIWKEKTSNTPQKHYNAIEITIGEEGGEYEGDTVALITNVAAFSGAKLITGADTEVPLDADTMIYLHVTLASDTTPASVVPVAATPQNVNYDGADYYIPIWRVAADGTVYDATIPGMTKRI